MDIWHFIYGITYGFSRGLRIRKDICGTRYFHKCDIVWIWYWIVTWIWIQKYECDYLYVYEYANWPLLVACRHVCKTQVIKVASQVL